MPPPLAADATTVVLLGQFRPVQTSPSWLHELGQISDAELAAAQYELLIPNEATTFQAGWLRCVGNSQQLQFESQQESEFERLRDVAVAAIRAKPELELSQLGINRIVHFEVPTFEGWHAVGDNLVRNDVMNKVLDMPGMRNVTYWANRPDQYGGRVQVQVEPSFRYSNSVFVSYNDHYDLSVVGAQPTSREQSAELARKEDLSYSTAKAATAVEILSDHWQESMRRFADILETVWRLTGVNDA